MADEAIVLVGGLGTRLRPVVGELPKPLAPVGGRPFLAWVLDRLAGARVRRVVLAAGYRADMLHEAVGDAWRGMDVAYSVEDAPLGTGGAIAKACAMVGGDGVHVLNGDTWLDYDLGAIEATTRAAGRGLGLALVRVDDAGRYGAVSIDAGRVTGFTEKGVAGPGWINGGGYFLTREAMHALPPAGAAYSFEDAVLAPSARAGHVAAFCGTEAFIDIGVPVDYRIAQERFASHGPGVVHAPYVDPQAHALLERLPARRGALFLDRDGVINVDHGHVHTREATHWCEGIFERVAAAIGAGLAPIVVTNQAGIGRGLYDEATFLAYTRWVHDVFRERGAPLLATYFCPHHPTAGRGEYLRDCRHRKPQAGMIEAALRDWSLDPALSALVGDKPSDRDAALGARIPPTAIEIVAQARAGGRA